MAVRIVDLVGGKTKRPDSKNVKSSGEEIPAPNGSVEAARTHKRFRDRVLAVFRHPANVKWLEARVPASERATTLDAVYNYERGREVLDSDPIAMRGESRAAFSLGQELARLNAAFLADRRAAAQQLAVYTKRGAGRDFIDDDESYAMRMFISDTLRPPGLEHLNTPGPLYALREDAVNSEYTLSEHKGGPAPTKEGFAGKPTASQRAADVKQMNAKKQYRAPNWGEAETDEAWDEEGRANRTPEQAMAEYWSFGADPDATLQGSAALVQPKGAKKPTPTYGSLYAWGNLWEANGGTRFMRYPAVPFWQKGGREGYDYGIEETLGTAGREMPAHVRRWDMDRVRAPRGQEYRMFGQR